MTLCGPAWPAPVAPGRRGRAHRRGRPTARADDPFWSTFNNGVKEAAKQARREGRIPRTKRRRSGASAKAPSIAAVASKPDGLLVALADSDAMETSLKAALASGIPVIGYNTLGKLSSEDARKMGILMFVGQPEYTAAKLARRTDESGRREDRRPASIPSPGVDVLDHPLQGLYGRARRQGRDDQCKASTRPSSAPQSRLTSPRTRNVEGRPRASGGLRRAADARPRSRRPGSSSRRSSLPSTLTQETLAALKDKQDDVSISTSSNICRASCRSSPWCNISAQWRSCRRTTSQPGPNFVTPQNRPPASSS